MKPLQLSFSSSTSSTKPKPKTGARKELKLSSRDIWWSKKSILGKVKKRELKIKNHLPLSSISKVINQSKKH